MALEDISDISESEEECEFLDAWSDGSDSASESTSEDETESTSESDEISESSWFVIFFMCKKLFKSLFK